MVAERHDGTSFGYRTAVGWASHRLNSRGLVPTESDPSPPCSQQDRSEFRVANLDAVVGMKLTAYRRKDHVNLLDMICVGLLDATWPARFPPPLGVRLHQLLNDPNG
jgi:hypothetical protein